MDNSNIGNNTANTTSTTTNCQFNYNYCAHRLPCGYCALRGMMCTSAASFDPCRPWWDQIRYTTMTATNANDSITATLNCPECKKE